jgi:hypothetical protein
MTAFRGTIIMARSFPVEGIETEAMSSRPANKVDFTETSRLIRREIGTEANARFLRRMPLFKADEDVPKEMLELLARLDRAERAHSR